MKLLLQQEQGGAQASRISELVEDLAEGGTPFDEQQLGGGPWQVCDQHSQSLASDSTMTFSQILLRHKYYVFP